MTLDDTSKKARAVYLQRLKEMTASERLLLGVELWTAGDSVQRAAARHATPHAAEAEIYFGIAKARFGSKLAGKAYRKALMSLEDAFEPVRSALDRAAIRYAIGGSWASTAFGEPRFTNDVDVLAEFTEENLKSFLTGLPEAFYVDADEALNAIGRARPFNVIYIPMAFKFDFFTASAFPIGLQELDRAIYLPNTGLSKARVPFVTPEDILLVKLYWFRSGGEVSEVQWRDLKGIVAACETTLDRIYLTKGAVTLGVQDLLNKLFSEA